jgi:hypothetical protein
MNDELADRGSEPDDAALRTLAARLGARAAERVDAEAVGRVVVERLRAPGVVPLTSGARRRMPVWLRLAAAVVILAGGGIVATRLMAPAPPAARFVTDELSDLGADQLTELLTSLDQTLGAGAALPGDGLEDLNAEQLERVLGAIGG